MGCWNTTCGISGLPIFPSEEVVVFLLVQSQYGFMKDFVHTNTYFTPCLLPFYGTYDDYGSVEDCDGAGLPVLIEALQEKLTELPWGDNKCHDIPAVRSELTVEKLFELDREDRLFICGNQDNWGLKVVHVQIKKSIFDRVPQFQVDLDRYSINAHCWERLRNPLLSIEEVIEKDNDQVLIREIQKGHFVDLFMDEIRKPWIKQIGNGSQNVDPAPYRLLIQNITDVLDLEEEASE